MNGSRTTSAAVGVFCAHPDRSKPDKRQRWRWIIVLMILLHPAAALAQSTIRIAGTVVDDFDRQEIPGAQVMVVGTDFSTYTGLDGRFALAHVPAGQYRLEVIAEGYEAAATEVINVVPDVTRHLNIILKRKLHTAGGTTVVGRSTGGPDEGCDVIERRDIKSSAAVDLADLLSGMRGLFIQQEGGGGGEVKISIRGCDSRHVLVLLDGRRINASGSGAADIGSIPLEAVERVEVYKGGESARFGADASGGVVNIVTIPRPADDIPQVTARKFWGAWKTDHRDLMVEGLPHAGRLATRFNFSRKSGRNDFPYRYTVSPRPEVALEYDGRRYNAAFDGRSWLASGVMQFTPRTRVGFSAQWYRGREGLPGAVSSPDSTAWKNDFRLHSVARLEQEVSRIAQYEIAFGLTRLEQQFHNRDDSRTAERYETRFVNDLAELQVNGRIRLRPDNEVTIGGEVRRDILDHDDLLRPQASMGRAVRDNLGLFIRDRQDIGLSHIWPWSVGAIDLAVRRDVNHTENKAAETTSASVSGRGRWSGKAGFSLTSRGPVKVVVRGSYGRSYRLPEMNALFWKGDVRAAGNPLLRPEQAEHSDFGLEATIDRPVTVSAGSTYFHSHMRDLIVWQPAYQDVWTPVNLDAARITGHEDFIRLGLWRDHLRFNYQNTVTVARNRKPGSNSYNKELTYRPHYVTELEAGLSVWKLHGSYRVRLVDIRYSRDANTKWYDAYRVDDLTAGFTTACGPATLRATGQVANLNNTEYVLIGHYPMPGRHWGIDVSLSYRID